MRPLNLPTYSNLSDDALLTLMKADDKAAFTEVYNRYWEDLLHSSFRILTDRDACMDILQEVFVWFWTHREIIEVINIKAYLRTAVKYQVANYIRKNKVKAAYLTHIEKSTANAFYEDLALEVKELQEVIAHFTADLPDRCREVFYLSRIKYLSNKEISARLGISEKTVEMHITTALKRLKIGISQFPVLLLLYI